MDESYGLRLSETKVFFNSHVGGVDIAYAGRSMLKSCRLEYYDPFSHFLTLHDLEFYKEIGQKLRMIAKEYRVEYPKHRLTINLTSYGLHREYPTSWE